MNRGLLDDYRQMAGLLGDYNAYADSLSPYELAMSRAPRGQQEGLLGKVGKALYDTAKRRIEHPVKSYMEDNLGTIMALNPHMPSLWEMNPEMRQAELDTVAMKPGLLGDIAGPVADVNRYAANPDEWTTLDTGLAGLGALPFVPALGGILKGSDLPKDPSKIGQMTDAGEQMTKSAHRKLKGLLNDAGPALSVKNPDLESAAKGYFGSTYSPKETGYILQDGTRLDLSGRHYASGYEKTAVGYRPKPGQPDYLRGDRAVDHRELGGLLDTGGTEGMWQFMDQTGAVRYMPGTGITVTSTNMPTQAQIEKVVKDFRKSGDTLYLDIDDPVNGRTLNSTEFEKPTVEAVMKFIREIGKPEYKWFDLGRGKLEVVKNPTPSDYSRMNKEVLQEFPDLRPGDIKTRFTIDEDGNRYIWKASDATHAFTEPQIEQWIGKKVNQNFSEPE